MIKWHRGEIVPLDDVHEDMMGISVHDGYYGAFTRNQYPTALPNGTRIKKTWEDPGGDMTKTGTEGTVLGSIGHPELDDVMYFVEWDDKPRVAVGVTGKKVVQV